MLPQKILKSRHSEMAFLAFSWQSVPPSIITIQTNLNSIYVFISPPLISAFVTKNINLVQVHLFKCFSAEVYSLLKASLLFGES